MKTLPAEKIEKAIKSLEQSYKYRADNDCGYLLNDGDLILAVSTVAEITFEEADAVFSVIYPNIKANRGRYVTREEEILIKISVNAVKRALTGTTPTREELREYAVIQANKVNLPDVEMFVRHCECNITMRFEMGTQIPKIA